MKICAYCHTEMHDGAVICKGCGKPFRSQGAPGYDRQEDPTVGVFGRQGQEERGTSVLSNAQGAEAGTSVLTEGMNNMEPGGPQYGGGQQFQGGPQFQGGMSGGMNGGMGPGGPQYGGGQQPQSGPQFQGGMSGGMGPGGPQIPNGPQRNPDQPPVSGKKQKKAGKSKKGLIIGIITFLVLAAAGTLLFLFVIRPKMIRDKADKLMNDGKYDEAIAEYEKLKDPEEYITECKYRKYSSLLETGSPEEAKAGFSELGEYKDSADQIKECDYRIGKGLLEKGSYDDAKLKFQNLGSYSDSENMVKECDYQRAISLMESGKYEDAMEWFASVGDYSDAKAKKEECEKAIKQKKYDDAAAKADAGEYAEAADAFLALGDYQDAGDKALMCYYMLGEELLANKDFTGAIDAFAKAEHYSDASERRMEAVYQYVLTEVNAGRMNGEKVEEYFKELYNANYKDSRALYDETHKWKVEFYAVSTSEKDTTSVLTSVSYNERVYFHYKVVSGETGGTTKIGWRGVWANGAEALSAEGDRFDIKVGDTGWFWFTNPSESAKGTLYIEALDGNNTVIGTATVEIVD